MKTLINELPVNPKFNVQLILSVQEYLNLTRFCSIVRDNADRLSDKKDAQIFIKEAVEVVLVDVTENTDAHLCYLIKRETENLNESQ